MDELLLDDGYVYVTSTIGLDCPERRPDGRKAFIIDVA
jgi:hypothetical protein